MLFIYNLSLTIEKAYFLKEIPWLSNDTTDCDTYYKYIPPLTEDPSQKTISYTFSKLL